MSAPPTREYSPVRTADPTPAYVSNLEVEASPTVEAERPTSRAGMGDDQRKLLMLIGAIVAGIVALLVILLPISFVGLEYYEFGFVRRKSTGSVDTSRVYTGGRYLIGPDAEFKVFDAMGHTIYFTSVTVFASDRLQVTISCSFQYFLRAHQLENLHNTYDIHYKPVLENNALDAVKGAATLFSTRQFISSRDEIEKALFQAVRGRLGGQCCEKDCKSKAECAASNCKLYDQCVDGCIEYSKCKQKDFGLFTEVRYFQLNRLDIPDELNQRFLQALVLQEETDTEEFKQDAKVVRKQTESQVQDINNKAHEIRQNATVEAALITTRSAAEASATVQRAKMNGLKDLYTNIGLTDAQQKASFDYLRTLKGNSNIKMAYNFQQYLSGPHTKN